MSCSNCNRKKKIKSGIQTDNLLKSLNSGLCKITIKKVNEDNSRIIYCTLQKNFLPSMNSTTNKKSDSISSVIKTGYILVWALDKTLDEEREKKSGWLKIKTDQIITYDFVGKIPQDK